MKNAHHIFYRSFPEDFPNLRDVFQCPHCKEFGQQKPVYESKKGWDKKLASHIVLICFECQMCSSLHLYYLDVRDLGSDGCYGEAYYDAMQLYPIDTIPSEIKQPNEDLPEDIKSDYLEAAQIFDLSPRGSLALLRLCIEKLCQHLCGKKIDSINDAIKYLSSNDLIPEHIQQALDIARVKGNEAVHPRNFTKSGSIDSARLLFQLVNFVSEEMLSKPKERKVLKEEFNSLPKPKLDAIEKRGKK